MNNINKIISGLMIIFLIIVLIVNIKISANNSNYEYTATLSNIAKAGNPITEWWDSKTHLCVNNVPCMANVITIFKVDGTWTTSYGGFGCEFTQVFVMGTRTECTSGDKVAHCWDCTGRECVAPNDAIVEILRALNAG